MSFHDPVIDGANFEDTDLYEWQRRPGFSIFCSEPLADTEIVRQFHSFRNLNGDVTAMFDSSARLASFTSSSITSIIPKTTSDQGFTTAIGNTLYFSDGASVDLQKWDSVRPLSSINPSSWGIAAPTQTPTIFNLGGWMQNTDFSSNQPVLDPNGNIEVSFITASGTTSQTKAMTTWGSIVIPGSWGGFWEKDPHVYAGQHYWEYYKTPVNTYSDYATFTGFGFSVPTGATITGVVVSVTKLCHPLASGGETDHSVKLLVAGVPSGNDESSVALWPNASTSTVLAGGGWGTTTYGSSTDTWGLSLTPAIVNAPGFGMAIAAQSSGNGFYPDINLSPYPVTIQVFYTMSSGPGGSGQSGSIEPTWSTILNSITQDGTISWTNVGPILIWYPATSYLLPAVVFDLNGNLQLATVSTIPIAEWNAATSYVVGEEVFFGGTYWACLVGNTGITPNSNYSVNTASGGVTTVQPYWVNVPSPITTGTVAPTWSVVVGGTTSDGDYTWTNLGPGSLIEAFGTSYVYCYRTIYGHLSTASPVSLSTGSLLGAQSGGITNFAISGGVVTFTGTNNFVPGSTFTVTGFSVGTYLNYQTFVVLAAGLSTTSFSANFAHTDVSSTVDFGQTSPLISVVTGVGTSSILCNATSTITAVAVTNNVVRITSANNYTPGLYVTFTGVTVATWLNNLQLQIINVDPAGTWFEVFYITNNSPVTSDTGTVTFNAVEIYRVSDGGGIYLFTGAVTNPSGGGVWTFYDFTTDTDLDELQIAPQNHLNDPPPGAPGSSINSVGTITAYWQGRLWMAVGNYVYFDAGPDCVNGVPEESWPPANRFQFAGPPIGLVPTPDGSGLLVYLADRVNAILGGPETISFYPTDAFSNFGISNPNAMFKDGSTIGQFTTQKQYFDLMGGQKQETGEHIADYLTTNFDATTTYATMHRNGLDVGMFLSNGVDRILRYGSNISAWSVPAFPIGGAGALRSIETSVGTYSLMLASPTGTTSEINPLMNPHSGVSVTDAKVAWTNPSNITVGNPTTYATVALNNNSSQFLSASDYLLHLPADALIQGVELSVVGKANAVASATVTPIGAGLGATSHTFSLGSAFPTGVDGLTSGSGASSAVVTTPAAIPSTSTDLAFFVALSSSGIGVVTGTGVWTSLIGIEIAAEGGIFSLPLASDSPISGTGTTSSVYPYTSSLVLIAPAVVGVAPSIVAHSEDVRPIAAGTAVLSTPLNLVAHQGVLVYLASPHLTVNDTTQPQVNDSAGNSYVELADVFYPAWNVRQCIFWCADAKAGLNVSFTASNAADFGTNLLMYAFQIQGQSATALNQTFTFGGPTDLWGMPWISSSTVNATNFGFDLSAAISGASGTVSISEMQVKVWYQTNGGNYLRARDLTTWADNGHSNSTDGTAYNECFITLGSITLSQLGAPLFPLQHVCGYFDAVGTLNNGQPSYPDIWILPNEISDTKGIGFVQLPEVLQEPPTGQNQPSTSILALRYPANMMNSALASQYVRHLQVKIVFESENAPNTIKAISFKELQNE